MDLSGKDPRCGEDVASYALGALQPEDARSFERHLADCELCRTDLDGLRPVVHALSETPEQVDPPPELRGRLMAVVEREAAERKASDAERAPARARPWWQPRPLNALAAACVVLVVGIGIGVGMSGDDATQYEGTAPAGVEASLRVKNDDGRLTLQGMDAPPAGKVMQVWVVHGEKGKPEPTDALFRPNRDGNASVAVTGEMDGVTRVMVSEEPEGGSQSPTTAPSVDFRLS